MSIRFINTPYFNFKDKLARRNLILKPFSGTSIDLQDSANSRVKSIGINGNSEQETTIGKNLLNPYIQTTTKYGVTISYDENTQEVTLNGTCTQDNTTFFFTSTPEFNLPKNNNIYGLIKYISGQSNGFLRLQCFNSDYSAGFLGVVTSEPINRDITSNTTIDRDVVFSLFSIRVNNGSTFDNLKIKLMISKVDAVYEPYTNGASPNPKYPQEVKSSGDNGYIVEKFVNKNLAKWEKGAININGNDYDGNDYSVRTKNYIDCTTNKTFTLSKKMRINNPENNMMVRCYDENKNFLNSVIGLPPAQLIKTITLNENCKYFRLVQFGNRDENLQTTDYELMCETGSTATDYEAHQEQTYTIPCQQPMRAIGDVKDTFVKVDGVWYERHNIEKGVLGTENYRVATCWEAPDKPRADSFNTAYFGIIIPYTALNTNFLSNRFIYTGENYWDTDKEGLQLTMTDNRFRMRIEKNKLDGYDNDLNNTQKCRLLSAYLNNNLTEVLYSRVEPLDLPCTQAQITALEALMKARTYKNITHIYSEDEVQATVSGKYYAKC